MIFRLRFTFRVRKSPEPRTFEDVVEEGIIRMYREMFVGGWWLCWFGFGKDVFCFFVDGEDKSVRCWGFFLSVLFCTRCRFYYNRTLKFFVSVVFWQMLAYRYEYVKSHSEVQRSVLERYFLYQVLYLFTYSRHSLTAMVFGVYRPA